MMFENHVNYVIRCLIVSTWFNCMIDLDVLNTSPQAKQEKEEKKKYVLRGRKMQETTKK